MSVVVPGKSLRRDADLEEFVTTATREYYSKGRFNQAVCLDACMYVGRRVRDTIHSYKETQFCRWTLSPEDLGRRHEGIWGTECGREYILLKEVDEHFHKYCPNCGQRIMLTTHR